MPETPVETVNRVYREFKRYTGDGLPNEPVGAPLPVGDPASNVWNPKKVHLREALLAPIEAGNQAVIDATTQAERAETAAGESEADADRAQSYAAMLSADKVKFNTVPALIADETMSYTAGEDLIEVAPGDIIEAQGFRYEVVASDAEPFDKDTDTDGYHLINAGEVKLKALWENDRLNVLQLNAQGDGVADDSEPVQLGIDLLEVAGGGTLFLPGVFLVGDLTVDEYYINFEGRSRMDKLLVKDGTLGLYVAADWVNFRRLGIFSQGEKADGLNTRGVLYSEGPVNSTGHIFIEDVSVEEFSGFGIEARNTLDFTAVSLFFRNCGTGLKIAREGTGGADFSTTINLQTVYTIGCDIGIDGARVQRSWFNMVIAEFCDIGIKIDVGTVTLNRCYFENNITADVQSLNAYVFDIDCYFNNPSLGGVVRTYPGGAISAADRAYRSEDGGDNIAKRFGLLAGFGVDPSYLAGVGTTLNVGLKYDEAIVPRVYGDDLLDQRAWESQTTSEFDGWVPSQGAYRIDHASSGVRGMQQSVTLDSTKTYVIDFAARNVSGSAVNSVQVDGVAVTPGSPFQVASTGSKVVRAFGSQAGASENYVECFKLMEVLEDQRHIGKTTDILTRRQTQRSDILATAAPTTGTWVAGERVWNATPSASGYMGWVCVTSGSPGTWKGFGTIQA